MDILWGTTVSLLIFLQGLTVWALRNRKKECFLQSLINVVFYMVNTMIYHSIDNVIAYLICIVLLIDAYMLILLVRSSVS